MFFFAWAVYFFIIVTTVTVSPYNFDFTIQSTFSWSINSFDMFENLFLLFPIGFFLTLSNNNINLIDIIKYTVVGFIFSVFIECTQLFLESRISQYWDVIANTFSTLLGSLVALCLKPFKNKLVITRQPIATLMSTLISINILLIIRLMMNGQLFGLLEFSLLFCGNGILVLIFSHYTRISNSISASKAAVITISYCFITIFPVLATNTTLVSVLSLLFGLTVPACVYWMTSNHAISYTGKKLISFCVLFAPIIIFSALSLADLISLNFGFSILQPERLYSAKETRSVGGQMVQMFLLLTIVTQLLSYISSHKKQKIKSI